MKNMVQVLIQPQWSEWRQNFALFRFLRDFQSFQFQLSEQRFLDGLHGLNFSKILEYQEVQTWLFNKYIELKGKFVIRMDYKEFLLYASNTKAVPRLRKGWIRRKNKTSYVRNAQHLPKNIQEDAWRIEKKIKKDKAKRKHWSRGWKKSAKKLQNSKHRQWIRTQLHRENWEAFDNSASNRELRADRWLWD
jgi:hypothetical protein